MEPGFRIVAIRTLERQLALVVVSFSLLLFVVAVPFARVRLPPGATILPFLDGGVSDQKDI
jgi:hypothetical protein